MKEIVALSGKGGTGKTSILAALGNIAGNAVVIADCDVDSANLHLLLRPVISQEFDFWGGKIPEVNNSRCTECGECELVCRFNAIEHKPGEYIINELECEGCSLCSYICPEKVITMKKKKSGKYFVSDSRFGSKFVFARLNAAMNNSGKLVHEVKSAAKEVAKTKGKKLILIDGPPGIGCPAISSMSGANLILIVTESTLSGISDFERIIELIYNFNLPAVCIINKADLNKDVTGKIYSLCQANKIDVIGEINFDENFSKALESGNTLVETTSPKLKKQMRNIWDEINMRIN